MSKHRDEFELPLTAEQAEWATREALASIGWGIRSAEPGRIVPRIGVGLSRNPSSVEVQIEGADTPGALVALNGKIIGMGPLQKRHLTAEMNRLRNAIEVAAHRASENAPPR